MSDQFRYIYTAGETAKHLASLLRHMASALGNDVVLYGDDEELWIALYHEADMLSEFARDFRRKLNEFDNNEQTLKALSDRTEED